MLGAQQEGGQTEQRGIHIDAARNAVNRQAASLAETDATDAHPQHAFRVIRKSVDKRSEVGQGDVVHVKVLSIFPSFDRRGLNAFGQIDCGQYCLRLAGYVIDKSILDAQASQGIMRRP